jgi:hypothetical protein
MKRRSFLRGLAAAPLGAQVAAQEVAMRAAGISGIGMAQAGNLSSGADVPVSENSAQRITSFAEWLKIGGLKQIKRNVQSVQILDPDIVCLGSVSLCAKIQMQRDRNLKRELADREDWFSNRLKQNGFVAWWGD